MTGVHILSFEGLVPVARLRVSPLTYPGAMPAVTTRRGVRPLLLAVLAALGVLVGVGVAPGPAAATDSTETTTEAGPPHVLVVGVAGLRWDDVDEQVTPALWSLLEQGATGVTAVRNVRRAACPTDGWLALSAGARTADEAPRAPDEPPVAPAEELDEADVADEPDLEEVAAAGIPQCRSLAEPVDLEGRGLVAPRWQTFVNQAEAGAFDAEPGLLGETLSDADVTSTAIGPGAAIALAGGDGALIGPYVPRPTTVEAVTDVVGSVLQESALVVLDAGAVRDPDDLNDGDPDLASPPREEQVALVDERVGAALEAVRDGVDPAGTTVLVTSLADSGSTPQLQLLAAMGPTRPDPPPGAVSEFGDSLLGSTSTRQEGLVQVTDLMPTVLRAVGVQPPSGLPGSPIDPVALGGSAEERLRKVLDLNEAALAVQPLVPPFFNGLVIAQILLYGAAAFALRNRWGGRDGRRKVLSTLRRVAVVFATVPIATFLANLVPWWRADNHLLAVVAVVLVWVAMISAVALLGPWRNRRLGPFGVVAGITSAVLAVDVATGSNLQISSLMGQQPVVAGRFYGLGNVQFALFATGALLFATSVADAAIRVGRRRLAVLSVVGIGAVAVIVDGTPGLGSDFGGPPAMIPAFSLLALFVGGVRVTWQRLLMIGAATVVVVSVISIGDWLRDPADRTHLGRFVETLLDGGAGAVLARKLEQNWNILRGSFLTILVPFGAVFIGLVLMRPVAWGAPALQRTYEAAPTLRHGLMALLVMLGIGFAVNDSGTVVPAIGACIAIPLLIAASVRTLEMADSVEPGASGGQDAPGDPDHRRPVHA